MMYDFLFTGDIFLKINNLQMEGGNPFTNSIMMLFKQTHNICINLETTVGEGGTKVAKAYNFQASPTALDYLLDNHIEICSLANNHSLDYGEDGLKKTIVNLRERGLSVIGTEKFNLKQLKIGEKNVSICSYYGNSKGLSRLNKNEIIEDIKKYKRVSEYVFVCLHWGEEYVAYPSPDQQGIAHALVDAGADVIIGHHPHVMQGYEKYKNGVIFYSLGNFNFFVDHPYAKRLIETTKAYAVCFIIDSNEGLKYDIIPININDNWQPEVISDTDEKKRFLNYFNSISKRLTRNIGSAFYLSESSPHFFHNHLPSWKKRIKNYGNGQLVSMIKWMIHPTIYKYYIGYLISLFHKTIRY